MLRAVIQILKNGIWHNYRVKDLQMEEDMKLLSIAIPSYNSQDYMEHCIDSLLIGGEDVEILIVDDGSKDRTGEIADLFYRCC